MTFTDNDVNQASQPINDKREVAAALKARSSKYIPEQLLCKISQAKIAFNITSSHLAIVYTPKDEPDLHPINMSTSTGLPKGVGLKRKSEALEYLLPLDSNTQLFTVVALDKLLREKGLDFDTPIKQILPDFELATPDDAEQWTSRDICAHMTGMPRYELLMTGAATSSEILERFKELKPVFPLRTRYQYCDITWAILDVMIERLSGVSYQEYLTKEILIGPKGHTAVFRDQKHEQPVTQGMYIKPGKNGKETQLPIPADPSAHSPALSAATGLMSNGRDLLKWLDKITKLPEYELLTTPCAAAEEASNRSFGDLISSLGMIQSDHRGIKFFSQVGSSPGYQSAFFFVPELRLNFAILTNAADAVKAKGFVAWLKATMIDHCGGLPGYDWQTEILEHAIEEKKKINLRNSSVKASGDEILSGSYIASGLTTWTLDESNNVPSRPECAHYAPAVLSQGKPLFASMGQGNFECCFQFNSSSHEDERIYGHPFHAKLEHDKLLVYGLSGYEEDVNVDDYPIIFEKLTT